MVPSLGKSIALGLVQWVLHDPSLEVVPTLEVEPPLEVGMGNGLGQAKRGQVGVNMVPGMGLGDTGSWMRFSWIRDHRDWIWPRAICGGRKQERL